MKPPLLLVAIACDPHGVPASQTPYASDVDAVRIEWSLDATLPIDDCGEPNVAIANVDAPYYTGTILIPAWLDESARHVAVIHDTVHWLSDCTGHDGMWTGTGWAWAGADRWHRDERLWWLGVLGRAVQ
jgi:hypothetical protein